MKFDILILGNGIIGCSLAYLLSKRTKAKIGIVGPYDRRGAASPAAAAMLNVFGEVDTCTFDNDISTCKFDMAVKATRFWPGWVSELAEDTGHQIDLKYGTFILHNTMADGSDDDNFRAIEHALIRYNENYNKFEPSEIPGYNPKNESRAIEALYLPNEGFVYPEQLFKAFEVYFKEHNIHYIDGEVKAILHDTSCIITSGQSLYGDKLVLSAGAFTGKFAKMLNLGLMDIYYGVGSSMILHDTSFRQQECIRTPVRSLACGLIAVPQQAHKLFIGASSWVVREPEQFPRVSSIHSLIGNAADQLNVDIYKAKVTEMRLGHRPITEDTFPLVGETIKNGVFILSGTKRDGLHMSPLYAYDMVARILGNSPIISNKFEPHRRPYRLLSRKKGVEMATKYKISSAYQHGLNLPYDWKVEEYVRRDVEQLYDKHELDYGVPPDLLGLLEESDHERHS